MLVFGPLVSATADALGDTNGAVARLHPALAASEANVINQTRAIHPRDMP